MLKKAFAVAAIGAAVALPGATFAQPAGTAPPVSADANSESGASYRATDLLNQQLTGADGQVIADIEDFVLDSQTNQVQYVVLSYGGAPDGQYVVLPFAAIQYRYDADRVIWRTPVTVDVLKGAPTFAANDWVNVIRRPNWYSQVNTYWTNAGVNVNVGAFGNRGPGAPGRGPGAPGRGPGDRGPDGRGPNRPGAANPDRPDAPNPDRPNPDRPNPNPGNLNPDAPNPTANPDRPNPRRPGAGVAPGAGDSPRTPGGPGPANPGAGNPDAPAPPAAPGAAPGGNPGAGAGLGGGVGAGIGVGGAAPPAGR